jgi:hypothetical protein
MVRVPDEDDFRRVDKMLDEMMVKHFEMANLIGEYRDWLDSANERPWDKESHGLLRGLPGAKYNVSMSFVREHALKVEAELKKMFAPEEK